MKPVVPRFAWTSFTRRASVLVGALVALSGLCSRVDAAAKGPKSVPVQIRLAEEMVANQDWDEATRRWIEVLYYFGPSDQEARADFEIGAIALRRGRSDLAARQWEKTALRYPDSGWAERSRQSLALLGKEPPEPPAAADEPYITAQTPPDERQFLIAEGDMAAGLYIFAIRDYLKIPNLEPESPRAVDARFSAGKCQALLGRPDLAVRQWQRLIEEHPESPQARTARAGVSAWTAILNAAGMYRALESPPSLNSDWRPLRSYGKKLDQGISYAEDLFENNIIEYALQEYAKVLCDLYTPKGSANPHKAYARYRMGVCAYRLGERDAAARQWRRLIQDYPDSPWADRANNALATVGLIDPFSSDAGRPAPALPAELPTPLVQRFNLANQLVDCGLPLVAMKEYLKVMFVLTAGKPNPLQAEACYRLGLCQHLRGRPGLAAAAWQRAIADYPDSPWAEEARKALSQTAQAQSALSHGTASPTESGS